MTEFKGTQGEWEVLNTESNGLIDARDAYAIKNKAMGITWDVCAVWKDVGEGNHIANAKLIAAAPELLKSLQDFVTIAKALNWNESLTGKQIILQQAEEVIKKALG